jgi:OOP family OmpA-OmpF porin
VLVAVASDPDGEIAEYSWDLGDGTTAMGERVNHTYTQPGTYTARLMVTDNDGLSAEAIVPVEVAPPPVAAAPRAVVRRIVLRGVNFNFDSSEIHPDSQVILRAAAEALSENPDARVNVNGHTDSSGPEIYNQALSERRSNAVVDYLVSLGVPRSRLDPTGVGESQPVADNTSREGRSRNRRVELEVQR